MKHKIFYISIALALLGACFLSLTVGSAGLSFAEVLGGLFAKDGAETATVIVRSVRFPRLLAALVAGAGLALSGVLLQTVMANPLAGPNTVGINAGAGLFTVLCLAIAPSLTPLLPLFAFLGAMLTIALVLGVSKVAGGTSSHAVILAGIACTTLFQAGISFFNVLDSDVLIAYNAFSAGSLSGVRIADLAMPALLIATSLAVALALSGRIAVLTLGPSVASSLGIRVACLRAICLILAGLCAASAVSFAGLLGFVGLVAPHLTRKLVGHDVRRQLTVAPALGALLVTLSDLAARTLFAPAELPVGVLMAFVGAPFLLALLIGHRSGKEGSHAGI